MNCTSMPSSSGHLLTRNEILAFAALLKMESSSVSAGPAVAAVVAVEVTPFAHLSALGLIVAPRRLAFVKSAPASIAPVRSASARFAPARAAFERSPLRMSAATRSTSVALAFRKLASFRWQPLKAVSAKSASSKFAPSSADVIEHAAAQAGLRKPRPLVGWLLRHATAPETLGKLAVIEPGRGEVAAIKMAAEVGFAEFGVCKPAAVDLKEMWRDARRLAEITIDRFGDVRAVQRSRR